MNFIRLIGILILLSLNPIKGFSQSCPIHLVTHYPNGVRGCLTDLPLSKIVDGKWGRQISEIASTAGSYAIAASSICKFAAIGTAGRPIGTFVESFKEQRIRTALSNCPSNCECAIVVDDGRVLLPQNLASLIGVNSETVASNLNSQGQANAPVNSNSDTAKAEKLKALAEIETAKQKEVELAQEVEKKRIAEAKRKIDLEAQAQKDREIEISKQRDAEAVKLAEAQKIKDAQIRLKAEAESKERDKSIGHDQVPAIYDQVVGEFYFRK